MAEYEAKKKPTAANAPTLQQHPISPKATLPAVVRPITQPSPPIEESPAALQAILRIIKPSMTPAELNTLPSPQFWRRISCCLYEQLVLLGVIAFTFLLPNLGLGILFGISLPSWLTFLYLYAVLGIYFVWYWTKSGQTLAMQTWRIRIIGKDGFTPTRQQACWRYIYGSLWLIACVILQWAFHLETWQIIEMLFTVALFIWPLSIYLDRSNYLYRQSLPDRLAGTRLVELPKHLITLS